MENLKQKIQEAVNLYKSGSLIKCEEFTKNLNSLLMQDIQTI